MYFLLDKNVYAGLLLPYDQRQLANNCSSSYRYWWCWIQCLGSCKWHVQVSQSSPIGNIVLVHLSTKCSEWAIVTVLCPSSVSACVRACVNFFIQTTSKLLIGFWPNYTWLIPMCSSTKVVQTVPVDCIRRSRGQKNRFSKCNLKKSSCLKLQGPEHSYLVYSII